MNPDQSVPREAKAIATPATPALRVLRVLEQRAFALRLGRRPAPA
ncbi:hypothetical protein [Kitasatospora sp. NPDC056181]